jgi:hypothetical protein
MEMQRAENRTHLMHSGAVDVQDFHRVRSCSTEGRPRAHTSKPTNASRLNFVTAEDVLSCACPGDGTSHTEENCA